MNACLSLHPRSRGAFTLVELLVTLAVISLLASLMLPGLGAARERAQGAVCLGNLRQIGLAIATYAHDHRDALVPAEYNVANGARFAEGWATLLVNERHLVAPLSDSFGGGLPARSVFRCPSGLAKVYEVNPTSRSDPEGGKAYPVKSESTGRKFYVHNWYGLNGGLGNAGRWPFVRVPSDAGDGQGVSFSQVGRASQTPSAFDGWWIHNGKDERVHARHQRGQRTMVGFLDGHADAFATFRIPSVDSTNESGGIRWRL